MTEKEMDEAAAELSGWEPVTVRRGLGEDVGPLSWTEWYKDGRQIREPLRYCKVRNVLPELLAGVKKHNVIMEFCCSLTTLLKLTHFYDVTDIFAALEAEPQIVVEAALRATGRWKE